MKKKDQIEALKKQIERLEKIISFQTKTASKVCEMLKGEFALPPDSMMDLVVKADNSEIKLAPGVELGQVIVSGDNTMLTGDGANMETKTDHLTELGTKINEVSNEALGKVYKDASEAILKQIGENK